MKFSHAALTFAAALALTACSTTDRGRTIELPVEKGNEDKRGSVVFGQVVGVHIDDSILKDGRIDVLAFKPVARLGYSEYTTTENVWRMRRPDDPK